MSNIACDAAECRRIGHLALDQGYVLMRYGGAEGPWVFIDPMNSRIEGSVDDLASAERQLTEGIVAQPEEV